MTCIERSFIYYRFQVILKLTTYSSAPCLTMSKFFVSALCLLSVALRVANGQNFNDMFDQTVSESIKENIAEIEPLAVPDLNKGFNKGIGKLRIKGGVSMTDMKLHGLSTIRRSGDASMSQDGHGNTLISLRLAVGEITFEGNARAQVIGIGPRRKLNGRVQHLDMEVKVMLKEDATMVLQELNLHELKGLRMKLSGRLRPLNAIVNVAFRGVTAMFKTKVKNMIEKVMRKVMTKAVQNPKLAQMIG